MKPSPPRTRKPAPLLLAAALGLNACVTNDDRLSPPAAGNNSFAPPAQATAPAPVAPQGEPQAPAEYQPAPGEGLVPYTVKPGDTLWQIARDQGSSVFRIKGANKLTSDLIRPGQVVQIPTMNPGAASVQRPRKSDSFTPAFEALPPRPETPEEIPAPRPSATNPVIEGDRVPASSLGQGAPPQARPPVETPADFPILPPLPEPLGQ